MNQTDLSQSKKTVQSIIDKAYENRTSSQHNFFIDFLQPFFPNISSSKVKLISFFLRKIEGPHILTHKDYTPLSFVLNGLSQQNPENYPILQQITRQRKVNVKEGTYGILLDYMYYLNCQALGQTTIQEQISFMHSSQYLCSIPKKRFYYILRNSKVLPFSTSQMVYYEGQKIEPGESGSGIYLVRKGQFGYFKNSEKEGKQIETYRFGKGHLFGTLEITNKNIHTRAFTLKCKSSKGIVYNFSQQIFTSHIKPYCEHVINLKQGKLLKYLDNHIEKVQRVRQTKNVFLSQTQTRGFNLENSLKNNSTSNYELSTRLKQSLPSIDSIANKTRLSQQLEQEGLSKTNYHSLLKDGPLKNYPMASRRSNFTESEFREFKKLQKDKEQSQKIKVLRGNSCSSSKGQILFSFFKNTWHFEKDKRLNQRRY